MSSPPSSVLSDLPCRAELRTGQPCRDHSCRYRYPDLRWSWDGRQWREQPAEPARLGIEV